MDRRENLSKAIADLEADLASEEREADRTNGRIEKVQDAIVRLSARESSLQLDLDAATHPNTLYRERLPEDIAVELSSVVGGLAELERLLREYLRAKDLHRQTLSSRKGELDRRRDDLSQLDAPKAKP